MALRPTTIPPAGTPGVFDPRNPTLIPNFDRNVAQNRGSDDPSTINHSSPAGYLQANPRANATATATIAGTPYDGPTKESSIKELFESAGLGD